jgi:hypothetical protein
MPVMPPKVAVSRYALNKQLEKIAEDLGMHFGMPVPSMTSRGIMPMTLSRSIGFDGPTLTEFIGKKWEEANRDAGGDPPLPRLEPKEKISYVALNSWRIKAYNVSYIQKMRSIRTEEVASDGMPIYRTEDLGKEIYKAPVAFERYNLQQDTVTARASTVLMRSEMKALRQLKKRINPWQFEIYFLSGEFAEVSSRSGCVYVLRKNRPTLAFGGESHRFLAALCFHPLGYYNNTFAGVMAPTDEVLSHLLYMRADEHGYWRRSNQHPIDSPASGV